MQCIATATVSSFTHFITPMHIWNTNAVLNCFETGARSALRSTCPVCYNLFQPQSELCDRRPLVACANHHTICADCCEEFRRRHETKCPTCGDNLLPKPVLNKALDKLIANCVSVFQVLDRDIEMENRPFDLGVFGDVYNAKWRQENVVVKVIKTESEEAKQRAKREANLTLRLNHYNVIKLFGVMYVKQRKHNVMVEKIGFVMEKAEHGSLDKWIGMIDQETETKIALGIIDGLEYLHSQKVMHRDIKPRNILICGPENDVIPKIADFDVATVIESITMTLTASVGEFLYMAPEVRVKSGKYGFAADIYSLAMTLFEMFNEQSISDAPDDVIEFILEVYRGKIDEIPKSYKVPVHLRNVIQRGWSNNPKQRPTLSEYRSTLRGKYTSFASPYYILVFYSVTVRMVQLWLRLHCTMCLDVGM